MDELSDPPELEVDRSGEVAGSDAYEGAEPIDEEDGARGEGPGEAGSLADYEEYLDEVTDEFAIGDQWAGLEEDEPAHPRETGSIRAGRGSRLGFADHGGFVVQGDYHSAALKQASFGPVDRAVLDHAVAIFQAPAGFQKALPTTLEPSHPRVFLVHGPDHSGKWTCALKLAQHLLTLLPVGEQGAPVTVQQYLRPDHSELSLAEAIATPKLPHHAVVLLRDCFERNVRAEELEAGRIADLRKSLADARSLLVLTGDLTAGQLQAVAAIQLDARLEESDLPKVWENNLRYWVAHRVLNLSEAQVKSILRADFWKRLRTFLKNPFHVHQLCLKLRSLSVDGKDHHALKAAVVEAAEAVSIVGRQAGRAWFDDLHPNVQLFGSLAYLFAGADRRWLEDVSRRLIGQLRAGGCSWLADPRQLGSEDTLEQLQLVEQEGRLKLAERSYEPETRRQVANRQHLLWEALSLACSPDVVSGATESWNRQALGVALGRLGLLDRPRLVAALRTMAADGDHGRAVIPGYALQELVRAGSGVDTQQALAVLADWLDSRDPRLMWAAAAAAWRLFLARTSAESDGAQRALATRVPKLLRNLATKLDSFDLPGAGPHGGSPGTPAVSSGNEREAGVERQRRQTHSMLEGGLIEALRRITLADPERGVDELRQWIVYGHDHRPQLGRQTVRAICKSFSSSGSQPGAGQLASLSKLLGPLLATSDGPEALDVVFLAFRAWLPMPGAARVIARQLLELATDGSAVVNGRLRSALTRLWLEPRPKDAETAARRMLRGPAKALRYRFERLLAYWCDGSEADARRIAHAVIARSYAAGGALPSVPVMGRAVAVVDRELLAAVDPGDAAKARRGLWRLLALLESRYDLALLRLGETTLVPLSDAALSPVELLPAFPGHRLLVPGLRQLAAGSATQVFVLAARAPYDLLDLRACDGVAGVCTIGPFEVASAGAGAGAAAGDGAHVYLPWPPSAAQLQAAEAALEERWARALAAAGPERWLGLLQGFGIELGDEANRLRLLATWAGALDQPPAGGQGLDPLAKAVVLLLFMAACDLEATLGLLRSWLFVAATDRPQDGRSAVARAAAFALIRLATAYPPNDDGQVRAPTHLFEQLAEPLAATGPEGVAAVVRLVSHWLEDAAWARFLAGDVEGGQGRLERWAAAHLGHDAALAERLAQRVAAAGAFGVEDSWVALAAVLDRLRAQRSLAHPHALPELEADQQYALVVVDTADLGSGKQTHRAALAASLAAELAAAEAGRLVPAIYRLGELRPAWSHATERPADEILLPRGARLPPLIGPLLQTLDSARVAAVLVLAGEAPVDLEDWAATPWWAKVRLYDARGQASSPSFATLPCPLSDAERGTAVGTEHEARTLANLLAGRQPAGPSHHHAAASGD